MCLCVLLSSTMLVMRDEEENVLTADNMFYNTLSARQTLRRHRRWSRRHLWCRRHNRRRTAATTSTTLTSMTLLAEWIYTISHMHHRYQADNSTTMPYTLHGIYLLTTVLRGLRSRSIDIFYKVWSISRRLHLCQPSSRSTYLNYACWIVHEEHIMHTYMKIESK